MLRSIFNSFCAIGADLSDPSDFLLRDGAAHGVNKDLAIGSRWMEMMGLLTSSYFAKREVHGPSSIEVTGSRPYRPHGATTWLKYITSNFRPAVPVELTEFLCDCHNSTQIESEYLDNPVKYSVVAKVPLPLGGAEAFLLDEECRSELDIVSTTLRGLLADAIPSEQFSVLAGFIAGSHHRLLPNRLFARVEFLLTEPDRAVRILNLNDPIHHETKGVGNA